MHIVMMTKHEAFLDSDVLKDARTRCISLFFKSLTSKADQVCGSKNAEYEQYYQRLTLVWSDTHFCLETDTGGITAV